MQRATRIEPTRALRPELENQRFGAMADVKRDWRVNFRGTWRNVGPETTTLVRSLRVLG